jgi:hypothetical protein
MIKPLSRHGVAYIIRSIAISAGIIEKMKPRTETETDARGRCRGEIMAVHGLRKFFDTTCEMAGVDTLFVEMLMGHKIGLKKSYFKPTETEILEGNDKKGYMEAIPALTIQITREENEKLRGELELLNKRDNELNAMKEQVVSMQSQMQTVLSILSSINTQEGKQEIAKELILKGIYRNTTTDDFG